ncbi:hypothetical protein GCM10023156_20350 [Novipirellula rosea]|uniref:Uncharacterized protein n=1 Tax=Novipirellula rosea TaxID=1031540 RepID=A0ABP8MLF8_9BACT
MGLATFERAPIEPRQHTGAQTNHCHDFHQTKVNAMQKDGKEPSNPRRHNTEMSDFSAPEGDARSDTKNANDFTH